jgi:membrane protease YdiL (CAAX protease family)
VPLILAGSYAGGPSVVLSAALFVVGVSAVGYVIGRLRLETGSVWPAIVLHAAWNSIIQGAFDPATGAAMVTSSRSVGAGAAVAATMVGSTWA